MQQIPKSIAVFALPLALAACAETPPIGEVYQDTFSGRASMGSPLQGTVKLVSIDEKGGFLADLGEAQTNDAGDYGFTLVTPDTAGRICATGSYADPATNATLRGEVCALVSDLRQPVSNLAITPWSHLASAIAQCRMRHGQSVKEALTSARTDLNALLGCQSEGSLDVVSAIPVSPTAEPGGAGEAEVVAGLLLGALSQQAATLSMEKGYPPGTRLTSGRLIDALARDVETDCVFDGMSEGQAVDVEGYALNAETLRSGQDGLAEALRAFAQSPANRSGRTAAALSDLAACLSAAGGAPLFGDAGIDFAPGTASGVVALETPVTSARVEALAFDGLKRGAVLGIASTASDGSFSLTLPASYRGHILLRASGTNASYVEGASGQTVKFTATDELVTAIEYEPSADGTVIEAVSINGMTTLATSLAQKYHPDDFPPASALEHAYSLFGLHLSRDARHPNGVAIARVRPSNLLLDVSNDDEDSVLLSLAHVGLSRWGAQAATSQGLGRGALPSVRMLSLLARDLSDLVFDGDDIDQAKVYATANNAIALNTDTLRYELARSIALWLENANLPDGTAAMNSSSLRAASFSGQNNYLDMLSSDTSELFAPDFPQPFDSDAPAVVIRILDPLGNLLDLSKPVSGVVSIAIEAVDQTGYSASPVAVHLDNASTAALGPNQLPTPDSSQTTLLARYPLDTRRLADGPHNLAVNVADLLGNAASPAPVALVVDNLPPSVNFKAPELTAQADVPTEATFSDVVGPVKLEYRLDGVVVATETPSTSPYSKMVTVPCNKYSLLEVVASDAAGHSTLSGSMKVGCDSNPPAIAVGESSYQPESGGTAKTAISFVPDYDPNLVISQGTPTLLKYRHTFCAGCENMPRFEFAPSDIGDTATAQLNLGVQYRYLDRADGASTWTERRPWTTLPASGQYSLELSDATLAPSILHSTASVLHLLQVRVHDAAGNITTHDYTFRLVIKPVPLIMSECRLSSDLTSTSLRLRTLDLSYTAGELGVLMANLYWPAGGGAAVPEPLRVTPSGGTARTNILVLRDSKRDISATTRVYYTIAAMPWPLSSGAWRLEGADTGISGLGLHPDDRLYFDRASCEPNCPWLPNDQQAHLMTYDVPTSTIDGDSVRLLPNVQYTIEAIARKPRLLIGGVAYNWAKDTLGYVYGVGAGREATWMHEVQACIHVSCHRECQERMCEPELEETPPCYDCWDECACDDLVTTGYDCDERTFQLLRYIQAVAVDVDPLVVTARDPAFPETPLEVIPYGSSCGKAFRYLTTLDGETITNL